MKDCSCQIFAKQRQGPGIFRVTHTQSNIVLQAQVRTGTTIRNLTCGITCTPYETYSVALYQKGSSQSFHENTVTLCRPLIRHHCQVSAQQSQSCLNVLDIVQGHLRKIVLSYPQHHVGIFTLPTDPIFASKPSRLRTSPPGWYIRRQPPSSSMIPTCSS